MKTKQGQRLSLYTVKRLCLYLRDLKKLKESGKKVISSSSITESLNVTASQFRKDLSCYGEFGKRGVGYDVDFLIKKIEEILGTSKVWEIALIGLGRLGGALLEFTGFLKFNLKITAVFDKDKRKIGRLYKGLVVHDISNLKRVLPAQNIKVGMLCTPPEVAQSVAETMQEAGIKAILNFTSANLQVRTNTFVSNVDMAAELQSLIYFLNPKPR